MTGVDKLKNREVISGGYRKDESNHKLISSVYVERDDETQLEESGLASIMIVTFNRLELARKCVSKALGQAGYPFELLTVDNGSIDGVADLMATFNPVYQRRNETNEGYAPCINQMLLRAKGDYLCVVDPDILLPDRWLRKLVRANRAIPNSGLCGYHCVLSLEPAQISNGYEVHPQDGIFGIKFFNRQVFNKVGYFGRDFQLYGCEDADMNYRCAKSGFMNYYMGDGDRSEHIGHDCGDSTPYRKMKWDELDKSSAILGRRRRYQEETHDYYEPAPAVRWL